LSEKTHPGIIFLVPGLAEEDDPDDDEAVHAHDEVGLEDELRLAAPVDVRHAAALAAVHERRAPNVVPHLAAR
jgi:hypothetical protein